METNFDKPLEQTIDKAFKLIWRANSISSWPASKLTLDLSGYKAVLIRFSEYTSSSRQVMSDVIAPVGSDKKNAVMCPYMNGTKYDGMSIRFFSIPDDTGITFEQAYNATAYNNEQCVPYEIYGLNLI